MTNIAFSSPTRPLTILLFVCKSHYIDRLNKELGIDNSLGNPTYTPTTLTKEEILDNPRSVLCSFGISTNDEELDLPSLYWISKLHKCPFKQRYIAGSAKCSTKPFQIINMYSIGSQNRASDLLSHKVLEGWCESDVDSEELERSVRVHTI
jgi:hypothetical protein